MLPNTARTAGPRRAVSDERSSLERAFQANAALPFIHFDCAAPSAVAMLTFCYFDGREAVAAGRSTGMPVKAGVVRAGARTTRRGAAETFTGVVFQDPVITAESLRIPTKSPGHSEMMSPGLTR